MATLTERLQWIVSADSTSAVQAFKQVGTTAERELGKADAKTKTSAVSFTKFGAGAVASAGVLGGALIKAASSFESLGLSSAKLAKSTGLSTEAASRFIEVSNDLGISTETLETGLAKMAKTLGTTPGVFDKYGVSVAHAKDGTVDIRQTFLNVVDALNAIPDAGTRAAASAAILGKGYTGLSQLIGQGSDQIKKSLADVADAKVISPDEAKAAADYRDSIDNLRDAFEGLALEVGKGAAPVIGAIARGVGDAVNAFDKLNVVTGGALGRFATIGAVVAGAAGGLSLMVGVASKVSTNLGLVATKLGLKSTAETIDATATEAGVAAAEGKAAAIGAETVALDANTAALEANATAQAGQGAGLGTLGLGTLGGIVFLGASVGALAGEAQHAAAAGGELNKQYRALSTIDLSQMTKALADLQIQQAGVGKPSKFIDDLVKANPQGAARLLQGLRDGVVQLGGGAKDTAAFTDDLAAAIKKQATAATGGVKSAEDLSDAQIVLNTNVAEGAGLLNGLSVSTDQSQIAAARAARAHDDLRSAMGLEATAAKTAADALNKQVDALDADVKAHQDLIDNQRAAIDSTFAVDKAQADFNKTLADLPNTLKGTKKGSVEQKVAYDEVAESAGKAADAHVQLASDQASAAKQFFGATNAIDAQNASLIESAKQAKGPARQAIIDYIATLNGIPPEQATEILAHVDDKTLEDDKAKIQALSKTRIDGLTIDVDLQSINAARAKIKAGLSNIRPDVIYGASAKGTKSAAPGLTLLGEQGPGRTPELVVDRQGDAYLAGVNGPILANLQGGEQVYPYAETKKLLNSKGERIQAFAGGTAGRAQNVTHITLPGATVAAPAAATVSTEDAVKEQDRLQAAMYETGRVSLAAYKQYVQGRMAQSADLSEDWLAQFRLLGQLSDAEQAKNDKDKQAAAEAVKNQDDVQKAMFETGAISEQAYKDYLSGRLGSYQTYSQDWLQVYGQIKSLNDQEIADQKKRLDDENALVQAAYKQAQANKDAADALATQSSALNDVLAAGAEGDRIQRDRHSSDGDKAEAVQKLVDAQTKLGESAYRAVLAQASQAGLEVGSIGWDRFMRDAIQRAINEMGAQGLGIAAGVLAGDLSGIPALANGGIIKATPGGTLVRAGEAGKDEAVVPLDSGFGATVNNHYTIELHSLSKPTAREMAMLAEELAKLQRRNGRSLTAVS